MNPYGPTNFHKHTFCIFTEVDASAIQNRKPHYTSKTGSKYYFTESGVYRYANHWSRVAHCRWRLISQSVQKGFRLGYADWTSFYPDSETGKLYFIDRLTTTDFQYFHHNCSNYKGQTLRTAAETARILSELQKMYLPGSWLEYAQEDLQVVRERIIQALLFLDTSLATLKKEVLQANL